MAVILGRKPGGSGGGGGAPSGPAGGDLAGTYPNPTIPFSGVSLTKTADQAVGAGGSATVTWATEVYDEGGYFNSGTSTTRIVVPEAGKYHVSFSVGRTAAGELAVAAHVNGGLTAWGIFYDSAGGTFNGTGSCDLALAANDYIEIQTFAAAAYTIDGTSNNRSRVQVHRIR